MKNLTRKNLHKILFENYESYKYAALRSDRITYNEIKQTLKKFRQNNKCMIGLPGKSIEGRDINLIRLGKGKIKILAWTQMHGDEPTATGAAMDVMNFLTANDNLNYIREKILSNISLYFIPMLNPDGAERQTRENSLGIDINRDALRLTSHEAKILWNTAKKIKPDFGFNLHDQNSYYTVGKTRKTASISLLAPPFDYDKSINPARLKSMQVVGYLFDILSEFIPGHVAKYSDEFEPRAFGDNFTKSGTGTILIESGYMIGDNDKSLIRKLNFVALLSAFQLIGENKFKNKDSKKYVSIPDNESLLVDLLLNNLMLEKSGKYYKADIGINREKCFDASKNKFYYKSRIAQIGDLSTFNGIEEFEFGGLVVKPALMFNKTLDEKKLKSLDYRRIHKKGIAFIKIKKNTNHASYSEFPANLINSSKNYEPDIRIDESANLVITDKRGSVKYLVLNGFLLDFKSDKNYLHNGIVIT